MTSDSRLFRESSAFMFVVLRSASEEKKNEKLEGCEWSIQIVEITTHAHKGKIYVQHKILLYVTRNR